MKKLFVLVLITLCVKQISYGQSGEVYIWKDIEQMKQYKSLLYVYEAPDSIATGIAVIVCPGGSYSHLMGIETEGYHVAKWLNKQGITAFVLRYRVGSQGYHHPAMIEDLQRSIQWIRENTQRYKIASDKLGVMGFSAGGHLVTMAGAFYRDNYLENTGIKTTVSLKPNFVVPVYPVVSMQDSLVHQRSRKNLLTHRYTKEQQNKFSLEGQIPVDMPPTFLVTAKDDPVVKYQNSVELDKALSRNNVKHCFLLYETGGHGYGMDETIAGETALWRETFLTWVMELFKQ
ncbi:MAG: alpha/beta hydrolase [Bacteroidales bacterium]